MSGQLPLGEVCRNASRAFNLKKPEAIFINTGDVFNGDFLHSDYSETRSMPGQAKKAILKDDILYSEIRPSNGRFAYVDFDAPDHVVSTKFMVIESFDRIHPKYLYLILTSTSVQNEFKLIAESRSGTFPQITFDAIAHVPIPVPEIEEQERIIESYFGIHDKIALNRKLNETLEGMARALFQSWFVDFDPVKAKCAAKRVLASRHIPSPQTPLPEGEGLIEDDHPYLIKACMAALSGKLRIPPGKPRPGWLEDWAANLPSTSGRGAGGEGLAQELNTAIRELDDLPATAAEALVKVADHFPSDFQESELGLIPEGWEVKPVDSLVQRLKAGKKFTKNNVLNKGRIPVFEQGESILMGFHDDRPDIEATGTSPAFIFGDHTCVTHVSTKPFSVGPNVIAMKAVIRNGFWTFHAIRDLQAFQEYRRHWMELKIKEVEVPVKNLAESFGNAVRNFHLTIESLNAQSRTLAELRDTLLPKLLTGEIKPL